MEQVLLPDLPPCEYKRWEDVLPLTAEEKWRGEEDWARARHPALFAQAQPARLALGQCGEGPQEPSATRVRRLPDTVPELHGQARQEDLRAVPNGTPGPSLQRVL